MSHTELIRTFYEAFVRGDAEGMILCYAEDIVFQDPAFGELQGGEVHNMWRMLINRSKDKLKISYDGIQAEGNTGSAKWVAEYTYTPTDRKVINHISASFAFRDGKIVRHTDDFDLWKWTRQALGWQGWLLGWSPWMKMKIQQQTRHLLVKYSQKA